MLQTWHHSAIHKPVYEIKLRPAYLKRICPANTAGILLQLGKLRAQSGKIPAADIAMVLAAVEDILQCLLKRRPLIDDSAYERVIERADVLASGGEFQLSSADGEASALATQQLAALLDALPGLLESLREDPQGQLQENGLAQDLDQDLAQLAALAERLQGRLG